MFEAFDASAVIGPDGKLHLDIPGAEPGQRIDISIRPHSLRGGWHKPGRAKAPPPSEESLRRENLYAED